jgi:hypothetical protein
MEIACVIDDAREIRVLVIDPLGEDVAARREFAREWNIRHVRTVIE